MVEAYSQSNALRRTKEEVCRNKIRYASRKSAWKSACRYLKVFGTELSVYRCWVCHKFHLTSHQKATPPTKFKILMSQIKKDDTRLKPTEQTGLKNDYKPSFFSIFAYFIDYLATEYENMRR